MMILDHIATSLVMGSILLSEKNRKILIYAIIVAGILPDALVLLYLPGDINYLYHRLFTNSIILMPLYTMILALGFYFLMKRRINFLTFFYYISLGWLLHIFLDLITPYGTQLLFPLNDTIYSLDILHSFDPIFLSISALSLIIFIINSKKKIFNIRNLGLVFLGFFTFYFMVMIGFKLYHSFRNQTFISEYYSNVKYINTIPKTYWRWRGIAYNDEKIIVINNDIPNIDEYSLKNIKSLPQSVKDDEYTIKFLSYARFPIIAINKNKINIFNAIYSSKSYNLTFKLDKNNNIVSREISGFDLIDK